jgi:methionyl-tRNA formyltransferase
VIGLTGGISIACAAGAIRLLELQRPGKRPMPAEDFLRGFALPVGTQL